MATGCHPYQLEFTHIMRYFVLKKKFFVVVDGAIRDWEICRDLQKLIIIQGDWSFCWKLQSSKKVMYRLTDIVGHFSLYHPSLFQLSQDVCLEPRPVYHSAVLVVMATMCSPPIGREYMKSAAWCRWKPPTSWHYSENCSSNDFHMYHKN